MNDGVVLLTHFGATSFMAGVQIGLDPLMERVEPQGFVDDSHLDQARTSLVVGSPMLIEILTTGILRSHDAELRNSGWFLTGCGLLFAIWVSTAVRQIPGHQAWLWGFDAGQMRLLVQSNWIRTVVWTARGLIACWLNLSEYNRSESSCGITSSRFKRMQSIIRRE